MSDRMHQLIAAKTTLKMGAIHEATALQVRNYPYLIPRVSLTVPAKTIIDPERKVVEYECKADSAFKLDPLTKLSLQKILETLRIILWPDVDLVLKVNGKVKFDSRNSK